MAGLISLWKRRHGAGSFEELVGPHVAGLYRLAWRLTGDTAEAEDLVQELLTRLYARRDELVAPERLRPWLARALRNLWVDRYRRAQARPPWDDLDIADPETPLPPADSSAEPARLLERDLTAERLQRAVDCLPPPQREVVVLHDVEGFTLQEVAEAAQVSVGTLKSRLSRARARLRDLLLDGTA